MDSDSEKQASIYNKSDKESEKRLEKLEEENKRLVVLLSKERKYRVQVEQCNTKHEEVIAQYQREAESQLQVVHDLQSALTNCDTEHSHLIAANRKYAEAAEAAEQEMETMRLRLAHGLAGTNDEVREAVVTAAYAGRRTRELAAELLECARKYKKATEEHEHAVMAMESAFRLIRQLSQLETLDGVLLHPVLTALESAISMKPGCFDFEESEEHEQFQQFQRFDE